MEITYGMDIKLINKEKKEHDDMNNIWITFYTSVGIRWVFLILEMFCIKMESSVKCKLFHDL